MAEKVDQEVALEELDVEEFASGNRDCKKPCARTYVIRIDREKKRLQVPETTGRAILALVCKTPDTHRLFQKFSGCEPKPVDPDDVVDFTAPGVERFHTIPLDTTEGGR